MPDNFRSCVVQSVAMDSIFLSVLLERQDIIFRSYKPSLLDMSQLFGLKYHPNTLS